MCRSITVQIEIKRFFLNISFVGIIDGKDIQSFIMHAITGQGKSYAAKKENLTDDDFKKVTMKVSTIAG